MLKLLSYNIEFGHKLSNILQWIDQMVQKPDIICFQEFPYLRVTELEKLKDYEFEYSPGIAWGKHVFGQLTAFNTKNLKLLHSQILDLGVNSLEKFYIRNNGQRSCLLTTLKQNNSKITIANLHLSLIATNTKKLSLLRRIAEELRNLNHTTIILGDFNYPSFWQKKRLIQTLQEYNFNLAGEKLVTHHLAFLKYQLDYVFYKHCTVRSIKTDLIGLSDHYPLVLELEG